MGENASPCDSGNNGTLRVPQFAFPSFPGHPCINLKGRMNSWDYQGADLLVLSPHGSVVKEKVWRESAGWSTLSLELVMKNSEFWRY